LATEIASDLPLFPCFYLSELTGFAGNSVHLSTGQK